MENFETLTPEEKWEQATIANNFIFYKIMHNHPDVCKELLEILLQIKIDYGKKGIRLDVYAVGNTTAYNIEMQATDSGELPERCRFYQSVLDVDDLNAGGTYKDLKTTYIIFICLQDIFKKGLGKYTFENICLELPDIKLNDRAYKYFFIAENYDKILDENQKEFLKLVTGSKSKGVFASRISKLVDDAKHNTQWRKQFMDLEIEKRYAFNNGKAQGITEGSKQRAVDAATNLLQMNILTPEQIAQAVGIPLEEVLELKKQLEQ